MSNLKTRLVEAHTVPALVEKERISDYAVNIFKILPTKSGIKKALKKGEITIDGRKASSGDWLFGGEKITISQENKVRPYKLNYDVVYEDDHLAVINKPAGIPVHSHAHRNIQNSLSYNLSASSIDDAMLIPRPVHRLDHETSGLLIIAKTYQAMTQLVQDLADRKVNKTYTAVAIGKIDQVSPITIDLDDKQCETHFTIKQSILSEKYGNLNMLEIDLKTGRRNQIRKHFLMIGNPILGDKKFNIPDKVSYGNGLYLIANKLGFKHPISSDQLDIQIPLPIKYSRIFTESKK